ncbi:MAG: M56 family metallopeptidase, partial [Candidatus Latescibacterota bacterium]
MSWAEWLLRLDLWGFKTFSVILPIIWQSSILLITAGALSRLLRDRGAAVRHALWAGAVLTIPLLPILSWVTLEFNTPRAIIRLMPSSRDRLPEDFTQFRERTHGPKTEIPVSGAQNSPAGGVITATPLLAEPEQPFFQISPWMAFLIVYGMGTGVFLLFFLVGRLRIRWMIAQGKQITDPIILEAFSEVRSRFGIKRKIRILESAAVETPLTARSLRPVIFLPERFTESLNPQEIHALALHELSHIRRWDSFTLSLVSLIRALFFLHPLVWIAIHLMAKYAEVACDNAVVEYSGEPLGYAKMLARIAEQIVARDVRIQLAAGFMFSKSTFLTRIEAILSDHERMKRISRTALLGTAVASLGAFGIALAFPLGEMDTPKTPPVAVRGKVVFENRPVFGSSIYLVSRDEDKNTIRTKKVAWSGKNGSFHFTSPVSTFDAVKGGGTILVRHPDHAYGWVSLRDYKSSENLVISLGLSRSISGIIRDSEGKPLPGAQVRILEMWQRDFTRALSGRLTLDGVLPNTLVESDEHGRFQVRNIPDRANVSFVIEHKGYANGYWTGVPSGTANASCTLRPEGCIQGTVIGLTGKPARKVTIFARANRLQREWGRTKTDRSGKYRLTGLPEGIYSVFVENSTEWVAVMREDISVRPGETCSGVDFSLGRGGFVTGRVIEDATGKPVPHCGISIHDAGWPFQSEAAKYAHTDINGYYRFRAAPGEAVVSVSDTPPDGLIPNTP